MCSWIYLLFDKNRQYNKENDTMRNYNFSIDNFFKLNKIKVQEINLHELNNFQYHNNILLMGQTLKQ